MKFDFYFFEMSKYVYSLVFMNMTFRILILVEVLGKVFNVPMLFSLHSNTVIYIVLIFWGCVKFSLVNHNKENRKKISITHKTISK